MTTPVPARPPDPTAAVALEAGGSRVTIDPARGGQITGLRLGAHEWLRPGGDYGEWLTVGSAIDASGAQVGVQMGAPTDDGELAAAVSVTARAEAPAGAAAAVTRWGGERVAYAFSRTVTVQPDGAVRMDYALESRAADPLPMLWAPRPVLALRPATRLDLPVAARVRVWDAQGVALGGAGAEHRWPILRVGDARATPFGPLEVDFTFPGLAPQHFGGAAARYGCTLFLDLPRTPGKPVRVGVEQDGARLEVTVDPAEVPHLRLGIAYAAEPGRGGRAAAEADVGTLVLSPCLGTGDRLDAAVDRPSDRQRDRQSGWDPPVWVPPGATRRWTLTWRGRAAPVGA